MLIPTKHENLNLNILVLGADLLKLLKKESHSIESLFHQIRNDKELPIELYLDSLLFLWLSDAIEIDDRTFLRRKTNAP